MIDSIVQSIDAIIPGNIGIPLGDFSHSIPSKRFAAPSTGSLANLQHSSVCVSLKTFAQNVFPSAIAGKIRDYNITKQEWVLNGETVLYASAESLKATLEYDFKQEKVFSYIGLSQAR